MQSKNLLVSKRVGGPATHITVYIWNVMNPSLPSEWEGVGQYKHVFSVYLLTVMTPRPGDQTTDFTSEPKSKVAGGKPKYANKWP